MPRTRARRTPVGLIAAALVAALVPLTAVIPQSQAIDTAPPVVPVAARASVVPKAPVFSAAIDGASDYQAQSQCTPAPKPGARAGLPCGYRCHRRRARRAVPVGHGPLER